MKAGFAFLLLGFALNLSAQNQPPGSAPSLPTATNVAATTSPVVTIAERQPNQRSWQSIVAFTNRAGNTIYRTNGYKELATGICYWDTNSNQWLDSSDQIHLAENGAAGTNTQHQVSFAADINTSAPIDLTMPDGRHLVSKIVGLAYFDSATSNSVMFAETTNSIGLLLPQGNQVVYTNAFTDFQADVLYTHRKSGFEQDVIFRSQPPPPTRYGLNPQTTHIQIWTEFLNPPEPTILSKQIAAPVPGDEVWGSLEDQRLDFGGMHIGLGKAFVVGPQTNRFGDTPVAKQWVHAEGRTFLVEEILFNSVSPQFLTLPSTSSSGTNGPSGPGGRSASLHLQIPAAKPQAKLKSPLIRARQEIMKRPGLVLDYNMITDNLTNFTFQSDTTYYISDEFYAAGTNTFEGGTVVKCNSNGIVNIDETASVVCKTGPYYPAIFTSLNDDSVGDQISGSTGTPALDDVSAFLSLTATNVSLHDMRFSYAATAVAQNATFSSVDIWNSQFVGGSTAVAGYTVGLHNVLITGAPPIALSQVLLDGPSLVAENVTADGEEAFVSFVTAPRITASLTNCLVTGQPFTDIPSWVTVVTNSSVCTLHPTVSPYQTAGAGSYYLANGSPYTNCGTTNINPVLLAQLQQKTTYPPLDLGSNYVFSNTNLYPFAARNIGTPDIGYHYDPIDYTLQSASVDGVMVQLLGGAVIGFYDNTWGYDFDSPGPPDGLDVSGGSFISTGSPNVFNHLIWYNLVQEQSNTNWVEPENGFQSLLTSAGGAVNVNCRFTDFNLILNSVSEPALIDSDYNYDGFTGTMSFCDCTFGPGYMLIWPYGAGLTAHFTNCLFSRTLPTFSDNDSTYNSIDLSLQNNLFSGGSFNLFASTAPSNVMVMHNNFFYHCGMGIESDDGFTVYSNYVTAGYNGYTFDSVPGVNQLYKTNGTDVFLSNIVFQSSWLGNYYQPTTSPLINKGSTTAGAVGLYYYTTQTNQQEETNSTVDIGFHYVAVDNYGNPLSTLWFGIPDYLADTNGALASWQLEYFGHIGLNPASDPYSEGTNLLRDYQSGADLTQISFTAEAPKQYINTNSTQISLAVSQGIPQYLAVLVDDTNLSDAVWTAYSSNFVVNTGTNQGMHAIWIGLKALPSSAAQTWHMVAVTLDTIPPTLTIFGPATNVVSQPLIQIQGFGNEQLSTVTFDAANETGILTNQTAYISALEFDTNVLAFDINYFQAYDIPLAPGTNTVTIHGADLAGNISTTNINLTLDYSGDTTPPTITVLWPTNGAKVGGSPFTLEAEVDDLTAQVTASINGTLVNGQVQRNGQVRGLTLPLTAGTNIVVLTATDPAGNLSTNSLNVVQSTVSVSVDQLATNQLNQPFATVTGSVSDPTELVFVNGVQATLSGTNWAATDVPVNITGMAKLNVEAFPSGSDPAITPPDSEQQAYQQQPPMVRIQSLVNNTYIWDYRYNPADISSEIDYWANGLPETNISVDNGIVSDFHVSSSTNGSSANGPWDWYYSDYASINEFFSDGLFYEVQFGDTRVVLDTDGEGTAGTTQLYAVFAAMQDGDGNTLPPEQFMIEGQTLATTDYISSNAPAPPTGNAIWGVTFINVPAGTSPDFTPMATSSQVAQVSRSFAGAVGGTGQYFNFAVYAVPLNMQLTVVSNAVQIGGVNNWAAIKTNTDDWVYLQATLSITNTNAANQIHWTNGEEVPGNPFQRRVTKTISTNTTVTASLGSSNLSLNVWIIWGSISYNFSTDLDTNDSLDFGTALNLNITGRRTAGSYVGITNYIVGTFYDMLAVYKVEIIGTLTPPGIGSIATNAFTFSIPQTYHPRSVWDGDTNSPPYSPPYSPPPDSFLPFTEASNPDGTLPQQDVPINDKIFAIDTPGEVRPRYTFAYGAQAVDFSDNIYANTQVASDTNYWYSLSKATFIYTNISNSACSAGSNNISLPTTWGDPKWTP